MLIVLPNAGVDVTRLVADMTVDDLSRLEAQLEPSTVSVALPRFTASYGTSLTTALASMGMGIAFDSSADFSSLAPGFSVNVVEHKTVVEVDETGTVAAAATGVGIVSVVSPAILDGHGSPVLLRHRGRQDRRAVVYRCLDESERLTLARAQSGWRGRHTTRDCSGGTDASINPVAPVLDSSISANAWPMRL